MIALKRLASSMPDFAARLAALLAFEAAQDPQIDTAVAAILADVKQRGDAALLDYTKRFDRLDAGSAAELEIGRAELQRALDGLPATQRAALETAAARVRAYHERQLAHSWSYTEEDGTRLGQQVTPLERVGIYVPGGKAAYPSSVLMNALPAKVAGVDEIIMVVPTPGGERNALVMAAAALAGVDRVFTVGGAQAVAALAYGTATIPAVDKIVGPGNAYVAAAKRRVFGMVGIDMVAGPSEILIICDGATDPDWIAMDMFSQAEHDELAQAILLSPDATFIDRVAASIERQLAPSLIASRRNILSCRWRTPKAGCPKYAMPARCLLAATPRKRLAITALAPTMCCRPRVVRGFRRRSASMIFKRGPALLRCRRAGRKAWVPSPPNWRAAKG